MTAQTLWIAKPPDPHTTPPPLPSEGGKTKMLTELHTLKKEGNIMNLILRRCWRPLFLLSRLLLPLWLKPLVWGNTTAANPQRDSFTDESLPGFSKFPKHVKWTITLNLIQVGRYWLPFHTQWIPNKCRCMMGWEAVWTKQWPEDERWASAEHTVVVLMWTRLTSFSLLWSFYESGPIKAISTFTKLISVVDSVH